jgi:hypothetical protein
MEAGTTFPPANRPISSGLRMKTHEPWSWGRAMYRLNKDEIFIFNWVSLIRIIEIVSQHK